ncbi:protein trichome birefringence-like 34 isoform X2 [Nicotiana tabacum]|uniref:Protein trichome birefringence-like 34 isoform X2 n=1 Tax=Nicotiana tabacum TaxID=4097 RepID=A0AC58U9F5_TOBAC
MNGRPISCSFLKNKGMGIQLSFQLLVAIIVAVLVITALSISRGITEAPKLVEKQPQKSGTNCSFMDDGMACQKYGRKNLDYLYWKWQPNDCDLPRFNATAMLEKLRNKRVVYVGDSLNRNQWVSMVCILESEIPNHLKYVHYSDSLVTFKAIEYNATIDFYWAPLLVESNCDDPSYHRVEERIVRVNIEKHARIWQDADVLVFNSYLWWRLNLKVLWGSFESANAKYEHLGMLRTYELGLQTWADWLGTHVNRTKTRVFFVSLAPTHNRAEDWGKANGQNCYSETEPISNAEYWGSESDPEMMRLVEVAIKKLKEKSGLKIDLLNITQLSEYRKEAHSSIYRKHWDPLTKEQLANPSTYADCIHWCLPGVPDVWNHFLYVYLLYL